jgi:hypothetical protein
MEEKKDNKKDKKAIEDEIFHVKKDRRQKTKSLANSSESQIREETIRKEIFEDEKAPSKEQLKKEKKIFMGVIVTMVSFALMFAVFYFIVNYVNTFSYNGVNFKATKMGQLLFYDTFFPVKINNTTYDYHFYLRTDPRTIKNMVFDGTVKLRKNMVMNFTEEFKCNGDGIVAIVNFVNLNEMVGTKVIKDDNATCDDEGRYNFVRLIGGNETKIVEYGANGGCYDIEINNCEILKGTEKFMLEVLVDINKKFKS